MDSTHTFPQQWGTAQQNVPACIVCLLVESHSLWEWTLGVVALTASVRILLLSSRFAVRVQICDETLGALAYMLKRDAELPPGPIFTARLEIDYTKVCGTHDCDAMYIRRHMS